MYTYLYIYICLHIYIYICIYTYLPDPINNCCFLFVNHISAFRKIQLLITRHKHAWISLCIKSLHCLYCLAWLSSSILPDHYGRVEMIYTGQDPALKTVIGYRQHTATHAHTHTATHAHTHTAIHHNTLARLLSAGLALEYFRVMDMIGRIYMYIGSGGYICT